MRTFSAVALGCLLGVAILLLWVPARWPVSLLQVGVFALAIAWAVRRPVRLHTSVVLLPLGGTVLWGLLQLATQQTAYRWETSNALLVWATDFTVVLLALQIFSDPGLRGRFLRAALIFGFVLATISVLQLYTANGHVFWLFDSGYRDIVMGPFVYQNQYAAFIELLLPLALAAALADEQAEEKRGQTPFPPVGGVGDSNICRGGKGVSPLFSAAMAAAMYASVIAAASRAGFVLVSAELLIVPLVVFRRQLLRGRRAAMLVVAVLGLSAIFAWAAGWNVLWERLHNPDPFVMRREFLQSSLDMIRARPYMGFGLGTWSTAYPAYAHLDLGLFANQAHNDWAQWACEGGLPFAALMLWIAIWSLRAALRSIWGIGVVIVFVHCFVDYPIQRPGVGAVFFLFVGLLASCQNSKKPLDVL